MKHKYLPLAVFYVSILLPFLLVVITGGPVVAQLWFIENKHDNDLSSLYDGVRMRKEPSLKAPVVASLAKGERVKFLGELGKEYYKITLGGKECHGPFARVANQSKISGWVYAPALIDSASVACCMICADEGIGPFRGGIDAVVVLKRLGPPEEKTAMVNWGADGMDHQEWHYKKKGLIFGISQNPQSKKTTVWSVSIHAPCTLKTKKNIGIGNSWNEVYKAYLGYFDGADWKDDGSGLVVGSGYGGIFFSFDPENKKVTGIYMGPGAF